MPVGVSALHPQLLTALADSNVSVAFQLDSLALDDEHWKSMSPFVIISNSENNPKLAMLMPSLPYTGPLHRPLLRPPQPASPPTLG